MSETRLPSLDPTRILIAILLSSSVPTVPTTATTATASHMWPLALATLGFVVPVTRRGVLATTAAALAVPLSQPAAAAEGKAADLVSRVSKLSTEARALQYDVRENGRAAAARVGRARPLLQRLEEAMGSAAPRLRLCAPDLAACECEPDPALMQAAAREFGEVRAHRAMLSEALASTDAFDELADGPATYLGGRVERELEAICEAASLAFTCQSSSCSLQSPCGPPSLYSRR